MLMLKSVQRTSRLVAISLMLLLAACSSTNPYQRSSLADITVSKLAMDALLFSKAPLEASAGDLDGALMALKDQRREWYESLTTQAQVRAVTQIGLLGLTTVTLYSALRSSVTTDGDKRRLAAAGAVGFGAYAGSTWFVNAGHEAAYLEGIRNLTCSMTNIEPLRMTKKEFEEVELQQHLLLEAIDNLNREVAVVDSIYRYPTGSQLTQARVRNEAKEALARARKTLESSVKLRDRVATSGNSLKNDGDLVFADIASKINAVNKEITRPEKLAVDGSSVISSLYAVKIEPANEQSRTTKLPAASEPKAVNVSVDEENISLSKASAVRAPGKLNIDPSANKKNLAQASSDELLTQLNTRLKVESEAAAATKEKDRVRSEKTRVLMDAAAAKESTAAFKNFREECFKSVFHGCSRLRVELLTSALAIGTEDIYKFRRPLSLRLLSFDEARNTVIKNPQCGLKMSAHLNPPS